MGYNKGQTIVWQNLLSTSGEETWGHLSVVRLGRTFYTAFKVTLRQRGRGRAWRDGV